MVCAVDMGMSTDRRRVLQTATAADSPWSGLQRKAITRSGRTQLTHEQSKWDQLTAAMARVLRPAE